MFGIPAVKIIVVNPTVRQNAPGAYLDAFDARYARPVEKYIVADPDDGIPRVSKGRHEFTDINAVPDDHGARSAYLQSSAEKQVSSNADSGMKTRAPKREYLPSQASPDGLPRCTRILKSAPDLGPNRRHHRSIQPDSQARSYCAVSENSITFKV